MLDDLTKEIKAQLYERVKSPLFGAFALSWVGWNYRGLLVAIADMPYKDRMGYLDGLYPTTAEWLWHCLGGPLLTAVGLLLIYPWPARWMYSYWAWQQKELKKVQQRIEDEIPLTQEEARALRRVALDQTRDFESRLAGLQATNEELKAHLKTLNEENIRLSNEGKQQADAAKAADGELNAARAAVLGDAFESSASQAKVDLPLRYADVIDQLPDDNAEQLRSWGSEASMALIGLVAAGGRATVEQLGKLLGANPIVVRHGLKALASRQVANEGNNGYYWLSDAGDATVVRLGLASLVPLIN
jgi:hypothetical protein